MKRTLVSGSVFALFMSVTAIAASGSNLGFEYQANQRGLSHDRTQLISVNTASHEQLMELHGIDAEKANAIIEYRQNNGQFSSFTELAAVQGIGGKLVEINTYQLSVK